MPEIIINLHMHTVYSDGTGTHQDIAEAAIKAGLDAVIVTDHNLLVKEMEAYYNWEGKSTLVLIGEEIHDVDRVPQKNHLLVFNTNEELADQAGDPQQLIEIIKQAGGLSFLAHPTDPAAPLFDQGDFSWVDWDIDGFTGLELWNGFSEFKTLLKSKPKAIWYAFQPRRIGRGPLPETIKIWDRLTSSGEKIVAVGGSDAHALAGSLGPLRRTLFPYLFHFQAVNTHLLISENLTGELSNDKSLIYSALRDGSCFIGYDLPHPTRGFRFFANSSHGQMQMGEEIDLRGEITLQIYLPRPAECSLFKDGVKIKSWRGKKECFHPVSDPGVYRVEAYLFYKGRKRTWIISNPIYVRE
jgi:hypothetical protein